MRSETSVVRVAPVADIPIVHELSSAIQLERSDTIEWSGTGRWGEPVLIRHEIGDARPTGMRAMLSPRRSFTACSVKWIDC
jgi:hypothetical protein